MTKNKKIFSIIIIILAIPVSVFLTIRGIKFRSQATISSVNLSFSQNPIIINAQTPTTVNIVLNADTNKIGFTAVQFTFDKTKVKLVNEITTSTSLSKVINKTSMANANSNGVVSVVLGLDPTNMANAPTGSFQLAQLSIEAVSTNVAPSNFSFVPANIQIVDTLSNALTVNSANSAVNYLTTPTPTPTASPSPTPTPTPTPTGSPSPTPTATATSSASPSPTPTPTDVPTSLNFTLKLQGISKQTSAKKVNVTVKNGSATVASNDVNITSDTNGIYSGVDTLNIPAGNYDIFVKEDTHLRKKFAQVALSSGTISLDWTATPLKAGDFNNDNIINIFDIAQILSQYTAINIPVNTNNQKYDVNEDGNINITDIALSLTNYVALQVNGD